MEARTALLALVVLASGCAHTSSVPADTGGSSGKGLEINEFSVTDAQLTPGQSAIVRLRLQNYHTDPVNIQDISLYNTGFLEVGEKSCSPSSIDTAKKGFAPQMECTWDIKAPENLKGFESKSITMQLNLAYESSITNEQEPMKVNFQSLQDIDSRKEVSHTYSNGEVTVKTRYENPVPLEGGVIYFDFKPSGPGRVDSDYTMSYRPSGIFSDCPTSREQVRSDEMSFSCEIKAGSSATRNLVFSTSYKYIKSPSLDIEVARP